MSNHPIEQDELMAYLDGELEARRADEAAAHLKQCPECKKLAQELQEVSQMLVSWQVEETEAELGAEVKVALDKNMDEKPFRSSGVFKAGQAVFRYPKFAGGMAALILLVLAVSLPNLLRRRMTAPEPYAPPTAQDTITAGQSSLTGSNAEILAKRQAQQLAESEMRRAQNGVKVPKTTTTARPGSGSIGGLVKDADEVDQDAASQEDQETAENLPANAPMIIRTADLGVVVKEFDKARSSVEEILKRRHGHVGELNVNNPTGAARSLTGTLRIPSNQLDAALNELKVLGRVDKESQGGEEVTQQYVDLQARLANAKHTEQRLIEIQATRTGKLSDVLAVEMQIGRVRGEIERMEAERKNMKNQVDFATLNLTVVEDYKADLKVGPPSTGTQFRNAAVDGLESVTHGLISLLLWLLSVGPTLLLWVAILFFPMRMVWRKLRPRLTPSK